MAGPSNETEDEKRLERIAVALERIAKSLGTLEAIAEPLRTLEAIAEPLETLASTVVDVSDANATQAVYRVGITGTIGSA